VGPRELQFLVLLGVLLAGFAAVREADGGAGDPARARA
jgi:hypothetical protein